MKTDVPFLLGSDGTSGLSYQRLLEIVSQTSIKAGTVRVNSIADLSVAVLAAVANNRHLQLRESGIGSERVYEAAVSDDFQPHTQSFYSLESLQQAVIKSVASITMFTSGTTGVPKAVTHSIQSLVRWARPSQGNQQRWLFTYNPVHMAGLQVFFQVFLGGHAMLYAFEAGRTWIQEQLEVNGVTHISATPTFYRFLLPLQKPNYVVSRITSGGEKMESGLVKKLLESFPAARFNNIFATTEAGALLVAKGEDFMIPDHLNELVKIDNEELCIHRSLVGNMDSDGGALWYRTGDMVEFSDQERKHFRFTGRNTDFISTGGNRVNLQHIQDVVAGLSQVKHARVYARPNALLGNLICADIVVASAGLNESSLRASLTLALLPHEIPRVIRFVDNIDMTASGKTKR